MEQKRTRSETSGRMFVLIAVLVLFGGFLTARVYWKVEPVRPAAWDAANPISDDPFAEPDFLSGSELQLFPNPEQYGEKAYEVADSNYSAVRREIDRKLQKFSGKPPAVPVLANIHDEREAADAYFAYRLRELEAYERLTSDPPDAKQAGTAFLKSYLAFDCGRDDRVTPDRLLELANAVLAIGSKDPLLRTYAAYAIRLHGNHDKEAFEKTLLETLPELSRSDYPRFAQMQARLWLHRFDGPSRLSDPTPRWEPAVASIVRWLEQDSRDTSLRDVFYRRLIAIWQGLGSNEQAILVTALFQSDSVDPWLVHLFAGMYYHAKRSEGREPPQDRLSFRKQATLTDRAVIHFCHAWSLAPELPYTASEMITVASNAEPASLNVTSTSDLLQAHSWFLLSVGARGNWIPAYRQYLNTLNDSAESSAQKLEFLRQCIETQRFDTVVPYLVVDFPEDPKRTDKIPIGQALDPSDAVPLVRRFLALRDDFRSRNPNTKLAGDNAYYRARLAVWLEQLDFREAVTEAQAANGDFDFEFLRENGRPQQYLWNRMAAGRGEHFQKVRDFDERLRKPWTVERSTADLDKLAQELVDLKSSIESDDPWAQQYFVDAEQILAQVRVFDRGEWVEIKLGDPLPGADLSEGVAPWWGRVDERQEAFVQGAATLMAPFAPPLIVEAKVEPLNLDDGRSRAQLSWQRGGSFDWDVSCGVYIRRSGYQTTEQVHEISTLGGSQNHITHEGIGHWLQLRVWPDACEVRIDDDSRSRAANGSRGHLRIEAFSRPRVGAGETSGPWRSAIKELRVRRLTVPEPPADSEPQEVREAYWSARMAGDPEDDYAAWEMCRIRSQQERHGDVLRLAELLLQRPYALRGVAGPKGQALFALKRYTEAKKELLAAENDYDRTQEVRQSMLAEICAAAPEVTLRDLERADHWADYAVRGSDHGAPAIQSQARAAQAAVHAARGRFEQAVGENRKAIELADDARKPDLQERQRLYEEGKPFVLPE